MKQGDTVEALKDFNSCKIKAGDKFEIRTVSTVPTIGKRIGLIGIDSARFKPEHFKLVIGE